MNKKTQQELAVDALHLAAYLYIKKIPIVRIERSGRYGVFYFDYGAAKPLADEYLEGSALVEPKEFASSLRELRRLAEEVASGGSTGNFQLTGGQA